MRLIITILTLTISPHLFAQTSMPSLPETESANVQDDKVIAFNELKAKALTGDLESVHSLAQKYSFGVKGICPQDKKLAFDLYLYAASSGHKKSQYYLIIYYQRAAVKYENYSADLLAEACMWSIISGSSMSKISDATRAEGIKRAGEFAANKNNNISESVAKLKIPEKENLPESTSKKKTPLKRFASFDDYETYRKTVTKDYLAAYSVIKNKLTSATPDEVKNYNENAVKLSELQKVSKAYLRYDQPKPKANDISATATKSSEDFTKQQFDKFSSQIALIEITTALQTPITPEQIKSGAEFVDKLKDLIATNPKLYIGRSVTY